MYIRNKKIRLLNMYHVAVFHESHACVSSQKFSWNSILSWKTNAMNALRISHILHSLRWSKDLLCNSTTAWMFCESCLARVFYSHLKLYHKNSNLMRLSNWRDNSSSAINSRDSFQSYNRKIPSHGKQSIDLNEIKFLAS